jgi:ribosomal protein L11 methyltransferase
VIPVERAEEAAAAMIELFPEGYAETRDGDSVEVAAFTDEAGVEKLRAAFGDVRVDPVPAGWEDEWKRFHHAVEIGSLWIGPPWERSAPELLPVVIDPGRAFGTGAHPTTQLCLELLQGLRRGSLVDLGSGSGVVAIAAARLGYSPVTAVDFDDAAVEASTRNATANGVAIDVLQLDVRLETAPRADVAVANIDLATIPSLRVASAELVTSGYYAADQPELAGFRHVERRTLGDWAADLFTRE